MKTALSILLLLSGALNTAAAQITITLQPGAATGKDTEIFSLDPTTNFETQNIMRGNAYTFAGPFGIQRGLFQFDLSGVPSNAIITLARLSLFAPDSPHGQYHYGLNDAYIQRITSAWNESTVTWSTQPSVTTASQVSLPATTSDYQNFNIDVTGIVIDMRNNPSTNHGFMLRLQTEQQYRRITFCTSDYSVAAKRPKLEITYISTVGQDEMSASRDVELYPNPCTNELGVSVSGKGLTGLFDLQILNALGAVVMEQKVLNGDRISLGALPAGTYICRVNDAGQTVAVRRVIRLAP
jgi:hypothetical protein